MRCGFLCTHTWAMADIRRAAEQLHRLPRGPGRTRTQRTDELVSLRGSRCLLGGGLWCWQMLSYLCESGIELERAKLCLCMTKIKCSYTHRTTYTLDPGQIDRASRSVTLSQRLKIFCLIAGLTL